MVDAVQNSEAPSPVNLGVNVVFAQITTDKTASLVRLEEIFVWTIVTYLPISPDTATHPQVIRQASTGLAPN